MPNEIQQSQSPTGEVLEVVHHEEDRFYELRVDGEFGGLLVYGKSDNRMVFTHTFITEGLRGRGLSKFMIHSALDDIRDHGRTLTNYCPVIDGFIEQHPEYIALIDEHNPGNWSRCNHQSRSATTLRP
jgi:predicted GNAT family acetyltransferase